ncbi:MAG: hypothetical protein SGI77_21555 [Pirellulaceae bacterium]|nr:hypothetical protein [Pirellulaceae bacterium]
MRSRRRVLKRKLFLETLESRQLMATIDLALLSATQGVTMYGADAGDESGFSVSRAGDVNRDGFDDWLIGAPRANGSTNSIANAGETCLIFGGPTIPATFDLANVGTTIPGTKFFGINARDYSGMSVSQAGDINGDGFQDLVIGAYEGDAAGNTKAEAGESYVIFGSNSLPATVLLTNVGVTVPGIKIYGADAGDYSGNSVSMAGDVNGDGFDDLIIGAYKGDALGNTKLSAGESYLIFGSASLPTTIDLTAVGTSVAGVKIFGVDAYDYSGRSVNAAGDINGDGFDDLIIGAPYADGTGNTENFAGDCYLIFGGLSLPATIDLTTVGTTTSGTTFFGSFTGDYTGRSISGAGDVNGDGFDDLLIGAHFGDALNNTKLNAGDTFLVFGKASWAATIDLANVGGSVAGTKIYGADTLDQSGFSVSRAGDINGDGFDDLFIGAYSADGSANSKSNSGESYIIFGAAMMPTAIDQLNVGTSVPGIVLFGVDIDDFSGRSVSGAGDVNGDGFDDILIGANRADGLGNTKLYAGESYLIYGSDFAAAVTHLGTSASETLTGTSGANVMVGGRGNDVLLGLGGADVLIGAEGNDVLSISNLAFRRIVGGNGDDTLRLDGSNLTLNLTTIANNRIRGIETIDITGTGNNTLILNYREVLNLSTESNTLVVRRNLGDTVNIGTGWTVGSSQLIGGNKFTTYTQGVATLKVQETVATIFNRQVFYNRSSSSVFGDGSGNPTNAIDSSKMALLPGQTTTFANYTNYTKGLNGLIVDAANLAGSVTASDFQFAVWNGADVGGFLPLNASPTITLIPNGGVSSTNRIKIEFADLAIRNVWLRITMLANLNTGLAVNNVFYFGNAVADVNVGNSGTPPIVRVDASDTASIRLNQSPIANSVGVTSIYDINKDGQVNPIDMALARQNQTFRALSYFTAPVSLQSTIEATSDSMMFSISTGAYFFSMPEWNATKRLGYM